MLYFKNTGKRNTVYHVYLISALFCASLFAGGCDFGLQAIIMSPGLSQITIQKCETVAFEGFGIGGFPFESDDSESGDLYGYYWDADGNEIDSRTDKRIDIQFKNEGTFTVSFTVTDKRGAQDEVETTVIVLPNEDNADCDDDTTTSTTTTTTSPTSTTTTSPTSPTTTTTIPEIDEDDYTAIQASITEPTSSQTVMQGERITFSGQGEGGTPYTDAGNEPYNYSWNTAGNVADTPEYKSVTVTFDTLGDFTITFEVRDSRSVVATDKIAVTVTDAVANCQGCCSSHGGVVCLEGVTQCADGTLLSDTCIDKGCDDCL